MAKILVTGANGHIGCNLCRLLIERGDQVVAFVRETSDCQGLYGLDVEYAHGDVRDADSVAAAMRGCQQVFNLAAVYATSGHSADEIMKPAVDGVANVLRAAAAEGVERVIHTSTVGAVGLLTEPGAPRTEEHWHENAQTVYFAAKTRSERLAWELADELGVQMVVVNPSGILGQHDYRITPTTKLIRGMIEGSMTTAAGGTNLVDVRDAAAGHVAALERGRPGERYILASDENLHLREIGALVTEVTGLKVAHTPTPRFLIPVLIPFFGLIMRVLGKKDRLTTAEAREYLSRWGWYDNAKAKEELGFRPRPTRETIEHTVRWLVARGELSKKRMKKLAPRFPAEPTWALPPAPGVVEAGAES